MSEAIGSHMANVTIARDRRKETWHEAEQDGFYENMKKWFVDTNIIESKLESYFPGEGVKDRFKDYTDVLTSFYFATVIYFLKDPSEWDKDDLRTALGVIRNHFPDNKQIDWDRFTTEMTYDVDLWVDVRLLLLQRGDEIIKDVLKLSVKVFLKSS
jgi:hypothetical protein